MPRGGKAIGARQICTRVRGSSSRPAAGSFGAGGGAITVSGSFFGSPSGTITKRERMM